MKWSHSNGVIAVALFFSAVQSFSASNTKIIYGLSNTQHFKSKPQEKFYIQLASFVNKSYAYRYQQSFQPKVSEPVKIKIRNKKNVVLIGPLTAAGVRAVSQEILTKKPVALSRKTLHPANSQSLPPMAVLASNIPHIPVTILTSNIPQIPIAILASNIPPIPIAILASNIPQIPITILPSNAPPIPLAILASNAPKAPIQLSSHLTDENKEITDNFVSYIPSINTLFNKGNNFFIPKVVINALMDKYFSLKKIQPEVAKDILTQVLKDDPQNLTANVEMGYLLFNNNELHKALERFHVVLQINPFDETIIRQISFIREKMQGKTAIIAHNPMDDYYKLKKTDPKSAFKLLKTLLETKPDDPILNAEMGFALLNDKNTEQALQYFNKSLKFDPKNKVVIEQIKSIETSLQAKKNPPVKLSEYDQLFNQFYELRKKNLKAAIVIIQKLVDKYPTDVKAQRELAYSLNNDKQYALALEHFLIIERLTPNDYDIKMQIAYELANLKQPSLAYFYFKKVTKSFDPELRLKANKALTNLSGLQTKILPDPWFADIFLYPLYYSRFSLMIYPGIARAGRTFGEKKQWEVYFINRTTKDNRSGQLGRNQLPQIFDDDMSLFAAGIRYAPFYNVLPGLQFYADVGRAINLIKTNPPRVWRNDFRGGLLFWKGWGAPHEYVDYVKLPFKQIGTAYADVSYFTRYNDNLIGYGTVKEGLRVFEYRKAELNLYARSRGGFDTNREFFNNFFEVGPGVEVVPNNRYNLSIRFESLNGFYIPVPSPTRNPYGPRYYNKIIIAEYYARF